MHTIQQDIIQVIMNFFKGADLMPAYEPETGLHIFQIIMQAPVDTFSVKLPPGFLCTEFHVKCGKTVVFTVMIHQQVFLDYYYPTTIEIPAKCYA